MAHPHCSDVAVLEINFFLQVASVSKVVARLTYPVANIGSRGIAQMLPIVRFVTKHNFI